MRSTLQVLFILMSVIAIGAFIILTAMPPRQTITADEVEETSQSTYLASHDEMPAVRDLQSRCPVNDNQQRKSAVQEWCKRNEVMSVFLPDNATTMFVDDKHKVLYCSIPKVGCTNWKKYFILLTGKTNYTKLDQISTYDVYQGLFKQTVRTFSSYNTSEQTEILKTYFKFVVVRHPMTRLLSAYRNKLSHFNSNEVFQRVGKAILEKYSKEGSELRFPTFPDFIRYLSDPAKQNYASDIHWMSFHELCQPCSIRYDYIAQLETLEHDSKAINEAIGAKYEFPHSSSQSDELTKEAFSHVPESLVKRVMAQYEDDMDAFGYNC